MNRATTCEPALVGSLLIGADDLVGELVRSRIAHMRDRAWGSFTAIGVVRRGHLIGGVVYHGYLGFDCQMSCAFDQVGWALPGTLRGLFDYPFNGLRCARVTAITAKKNRKARKLLSDLGFTEEGAHRRGLDGVNDAISYGLLKENCKWIDHGQIDATTARAA